MFLFEKGLDTCFGTTLPGYQAPERKDFKIKFYIIFHSKYNEKLCYSVNEEIAQDGHNL